MMSVYLTFMTKNNIIFSISISLKESTDEDIYS